MTPRQDSTSSTELEEGTNAGGAAPPRQGAPSEQLAAGAEAAAAGTAAGAELGTPRMELAPRTEAALAGHILAHGEGDSLDPAVCLVCNEHTFGEAAMVTASCGHPFHPKCIEDALKLDKTKCPCGAAYPPGEKPVVGNPVHKRMMDRQKVQCPQGCGAVTPFGQLSEHVHNAGGCPNAPYRCGNSGCGVLFLRKDKDGHLSSCSHRLVPCELCEQLIKHRDLLQHKAEQCPRRKICCPHCQGEHLFCDTEEHMRRCPGGVSMGTITELKEMMAQQQQMMARQQQMMARQQQTIERQQREIADLQSFQLGAAETIVRCHPVCEAQDRMRIEQEQEQGAAELRRLDQQQAQRVPGLAEARRGMLLQHPKREAAARGAIAQEREQSLAELRRLDEQQSQRVPGLGEARERATLPQRLTIRMPGYRWAGEYSLRPERVNGAAVWGNGDYRLYRSREGHWGLTGKADGPQRNSGPFRLSSQPGSRAPLGGGWEYNGGHDDMSRADSWRPYPQLSVTAP